MKRQYLLFLSLLALLIVSSSMVIAPIANEGLQGLKALPEESEDLQGMPQFASAPQIPPPEGPSWDGTQYSYEGLGQVLNGGEKAYGTTTTLQVSNLDFGGTSIGQIGLPQGWTGYQLTASVFNLFDNITHIEGNTRNGNFESGTTTPTYWVQSQRGLSGSGIDALGWNYGTNWGQTGKGINVQANMSGYAWKSNPTLTEYIGWTQTIDLNRLGVTSATLSFDVQFYDDGIHGRDDDDEMAVYVELGGAQHIFVCHRYCLNAMRGGWGFHNIELSLSVEELQAWTSDTINVTLGMTVDFDWTISNYFNMDFDNVVLTIRGQPSPIANGIQLRFNSTSDWTSPTYGSGTISLTGIWGPYSSNTDIYATWSTASARSRDVDFDYTLTLYIKRTTSTEAQTGPEGTTFAVKHGEDVYWTAWFFAPFYSIYYANYEFALEKPSAETWSLYQALDPNLLDQTAAIIAASNATHFKLPPSVVTGFGWWKFTFNSTNVISSTTPIQSTYYISPRTPSQLSITVTHTKSAGETNLTLYRSDGTIAHEQPSPFSGTTTLGFNIDFNSGTTYSAGRYTLCLSYDNGATPTQTAAGFYAVSFNIEHDTTLIPEQNPVPVTHSTTGFFYPRVSYEDLDWSNQFISNVTGDVQINGTVNGNFIIFHQVGSLYQAKVANDLLDPGNWVLQVQADSRYYDTALTNINLEVRSDATLTSPESPGITIPYDESFTLHVFYNYSGGVGISGATITTSWGPTGTSNGTPGWYDITLDSGTRPSPGTYPLTITAQRNFYTTRTLVLTIVVREIATTIDYTPPGAIPWDENVSIDFTFMANDPDSTNHDGDPITSANFAIQLDGSPLTEGVDYTNTNNGAGSYTLTLLASSGKISTIKTGYILIIYGNPSNAMYADASRTVTFSIRDLNTIITYLPPSSQPWGSDLTITLNFTIDDPDSSNHDGENIAGLTLSDVSCMLGGSPLGSFGWTPLGGGQYNLTIYSSDILTVQVYSLTITVTHSSSQYQSASRTISFQITGHNTQTVVNQPDPTAYGLQTTVTIQWIDLVTDTDLTDTQLSYLTLRFANGTYLPDQTSLSFILDTSAWKPGEYTLTVRTYPTTTSYIGSSGTLRITILIHQTAVTVIPPEATPWGQTTNITIQWFDLTAGGEIDIGEVYRIVISGAVSDTITNPTSWSVIVDTSGLGLGTHALTITVEAKTGPRIYADSSGNVNVVIRSHRVYVLVTGPAPVPEDGSFELSVSWTDLDTGLPIDNGTYLLEVRVTQISGPIAPTLPWSEFSNLEFVIDATGWDRGTHRLNVTVYANSPNFATGFGAVNVIIRVHSITADVDPIPRVPYGNDVLITLRVNDSDLVPPAGLPENQIASIVITGGPATITLDSLNWALWVSNGTADDGIYLITLDVSSWNLGTYTLQFNVYTSIEYGNGVVITPLTIRALATSFTYQSPPVVAWGEDGKLIVTYLVSDPAAFQDGDPIAPPSITIAILDGATPLTRYTHFDWVYWQNGKYNITIFSSYLTLVKIYQFDISISKGAQYASGQLDDVPLTVRPLFTWLHPTTVPLTPFGDDVIIEVEYIVLDGESSLNGLPIHTGTESITVTGLDGFNPTLVTWQWIGASSVYRITIDASEVSLIQAYKIMISISGSGSGYAPDVIPELTFTVRTVFTAMTIEPVDAQPYLDNLTIRITYRVNDPDSSINNQGIEGQASIIELVEYPGLYTVIERGLGVYDIIINSTGLGAPNSYIATINTDWTQSPPPYAIQTKQVTLIVTARTTSIRRTVTGEYGYLDDIVVNFTYSDFLRSEWITNTSFGGNHVLLQLYNVTDSQPIPNEYWDVFSIIGGTDAFQLRIAADSFGQVNRFFDFKAVVSWQVGTAPYFVTHEFEFRAYVVGQRTEVIIQAGEVNSPYGSAIIITFRFTTEQGNSINQTDYPNIDVTVLCEQLPSWGIKTIDWNYFYIPGSSGFYEIQIYSTRLAGIGSYTFYINVTYPGGLAPFFESQYNEPVSRGVRNIDTFLYYIDPGSVYSGDDLNITVRYWNLDNNSAVYDNPPITYFITGGDCHSNRSLGGGWWEFIVDTSGLAAGTEFDIWVYAHQNFYKFKNISIPIYIFEVPLEIELLTTGVISVFFGETPYPIIILNLTIGAGSDVDDPVTDATVIGVWDYGILVFESESNGIYWKEISSLYDKGPYFIEIIAFKAGYFANDTRIISYIITAGPSQLDTYQCGPTAGVDEGTSFILYANQPYFIGVWFRTLAGDNITGAIVSYSSAYSDIGSGTLPEVSPGIYGKWFDSSTYGKVLYSMEVIADTATRNVQSQRLQFQLDVRFTPARMVPEEGIYFIKAEYFNNFTITIYLNDTLNNLPILNQNITATWEPLPGGSASLYSWTGGYYNFTFPATLAAGFTYELYLDFNGPGSFDCPRITLTIQILHRRANPIDQMEIVSVRDDWNSTIIILQVPVGDWLFIYLNYTDADGVPIRDGEGLVKVGDVSVLGAFQYDADKGLYVAMLDASLFGRGTHSLRVTISKTNYESKVYTTNFEVIRIPTELRVIEINGFNVTGLFTFDLYIGSQVSMKILLLDTWHNQGVENATLILPASLASSFRINELGNGLYEIIGSYNTFSLQDISILLSIRAEKNEPLSHEAALLENWSLLFRPQPLFLVGFFGGISAAVLLIIILLSWVLWARVFSIPWEVRRMRKLAKTIEKDEAYSLSKKDLKRFHERGIVLEGKVDSAMSTIGVAATAAMIPTVEEVEEITATEEDIMAELDKIPGLGPAEKKVLAEEMRKIPRKDRIWFLDDLRRQMGQRRMDFLTKREEHRPPAKVERKPAGKAPKKPAKKPDVEPAVEPLEKIKPVEPPPPEKVLKEDRTAPTVLPPEERVITPVLPEVEREIRRELDKIPGLSEDEKQALVDHLKHLSKEERQATYFSLRQSANED